MVPAAGYRTDSKKPNVFKASWHCFTLIVQQVCAAGQRPFWDHRAEKLTSLKGRLGSQQFQTAWPMHAQAGKAEHTCLQSLGSRPGRLAKSVHRNTAPSIFNC